MIEQHHYEGHTIEIELREVTPRHVAWLSRIDGCHRQKGGVASPTIAAARSEALLYAQLMLLRLHPREAATD